MCQSYSEVKSCLDTGTMLNSICDCSCLSNMSLLERVTISLIRKLMFRKRLDEWPQNCYSCDRVDFVNRCFEGT
jgi:hypothetical protein